MYQTMEMLRHCLRYIYHDMIIDLLIPFPGIQHAFAKLCIIAIRSSRLAIGNIWRAFTCA